MSLDLTVLRVLKHRGRHDRLARQVPTNALDMPTRIMLADFGEYFREHPDVQTIEPAPFKLWFLGFKHKTMPENAKAVYEKVIEQFEIDVDSSVEGGLLARLIASDAAYRVAELARQYSDGEEVDIRQGIQAVVDDYDKYLNRKVKNPQVLDPIEDLLKQEENDEGLHWRMDCINRHIRPLRGGDFVVVAARPDKGKTSWCADQLTFMAPQIDKFWPGEKRSILWFNNEGPGKRIVQRNFQAAGGWTIEEMVKLSNTPASTKELRERYKTLLREKYVEALGGRAGVLRVFDIHGMWNHEVEDIMKLYTPGLVLFDMVDNIKFGGEVLNHGERTDQLLEGMYQWARMMGVKYDCPILATSQISDGGDGERWPTLPQLKDSRTGKQGAADVIITLGTVNDPTLENMRYIGTTKNKKVRTGVSASPQATVTFDKDRSRFVEIT